MSRLTRRPVPGTESSGSAPFPSVRLASLLAPCRQPSEARPPNVALETGQQQTALPV